MTQEKKRKGDAERHIIHRKVSRAGNPSGKYTCPPPLFFKPLGSDKSRKKHTQSSINIKRVHFVKVAKPRCVSLQLLEVAEIKSASRSSEAA